MKQQQTYKSSAAIKINELLAQTKRNSVKNPLFHATLSNLEAVNSEDNSVNTNEVS